MTRTTISYDRKTEQIIETRIEEIPGQLDITSFCKFMLDSYENHVEETNEASLVKDM